MTENNNKLPNIRTQLPPHLERARKDSRSNTIVDAFHFHYHNEYKLTKQEYKLILKTFNHLLMRYMIEDGNDIKLPNFLGRMTIRKRKGGQPYDYGSYFKTGILKRHKNKHSDGYYAKWYWDTNYPQAQFIFKNLWKFDAARSHKRYLAKQIKENNYINKYYEYED